MVSSLQRAGLDYQQRNPWRPVSASRRIVGGGHPGLELLRTEPVFWVDAAMSTVSGGKLVNLGSGGSALDAQFGSTTGTDTNDPTLLPHTGTNYLYLTGVAGNFCTVPTGALNSLTGDIEIVGRATMGTSSGGRLFSTINGAAVATGGGYECFIGVTGMSFQASNGTVNSTVPSTGLAFTQGTTYWYRARFRASNQAVTFDWAVDQPTEPTAWTAATGGTLGITAPSTNAITPSIGGMQGLAREWEGGFYRCIIRSNWTTTPVTVLDADFTRGITTGGQTTFTCTTGQVVTIGRATSGRKAVAVTRPVVLLGTDDYLVIADSDLLDRGASEAFSAIVVVRQWNTPVNFRQYLSKGSGVATDAGWVLGVTGTTVQGWSHVGDGVAGSQASMNNVWSAGALGVLGVTISAAATPTVTRYLNNSAATTSATALGSSANALPMYIGSTANVIATQDFEFVAAAVFRRALTAAEISSLVSYYGAA